jgi:hypothetical protein
MRVPDPIARLKEVGERYIDALFRYDAGQVPIEQLQQLAREFAREYARLREARRERLS